MRIKIKLLIIILIVALLFSRTIYAQTITLTDTNVAAWDVPDPNSTPAIDYKGEFYTPQHINNSLPTSGPDLVLDFGNSMTDPLKSPTLKPLLQPNVLYYMFARAYAANGMFSGLSNIVGPIFAPSMQASPCDSPTPHNITIQIKSWLPSVAVGAKGQVLFDLSNSFPIVQIQIHLQPDNQTAGEVIGQELRDVSALNFAVPRTPGSYQFTVFAKDSVGCTAETTITRTFTVF